MARHEHRHYRVVGFRSSSGLIPGLILVGIGALFFLNNLGLFYVREWLAYWPVILIALGGVKMLDSSFSGGRAAGAVLFGAGVILLAQTLGFLQIRMREMWPLILIGLGVLLIFQRVQMQVRMPGIMNDTPPSPDTLKIDAIFSGGKRVVTSQDFQGGEINSIFGGVELDLRPAAIARDAATIEVNAIFGGVELKIPQGWNAVVEAVGVFGGVSDSTFKPDLQAPGVKHLIVRGSAVFGGVDIKN